MGLSIRYGTVLWRFVRELRRNPLLVVAVLVLILIIVVSAIASSVAPFDLDYMSLRNRLRPPSIKNGSYLGTDALGRDVLTQLLYATRITLLISGSAILMAALVGSIVGMLSGYYGGLLDVLVMRLVDMQLSIPTFFFALAGTALLGRGMINLVIVLALSGWARFARVARGSMLTAKEDLYVLGARSLGVSDSRIIFIHILPNIISSLMVLFSVNLPHMIMVEASLSFVGLGMSAETPSLGKIISEGFDHLLSGHWWISILPGIVLMILVLSINTLADTLRDVLDVQQQ